MDLLGPDGEPDAGRVHRGDRRDGEGSSPGRTAGPRHARARPGERNCAGRNTFPRARPDDALRHLPRSTQKGRFLLHGRGSPRRCSAEKPFKSRGHGPSPTLTAEEALRLDQNFEIVASARRRTDIVARRYMLKHRDGSASRPRSRRSRSSGTARWRRLRHRPRPSRSASASSTSCAQSEERYRFLVENSPGHHLRDRRRRRLHLFSEAVEAILG